MQTRIIINIKQQLLDIYQENTLVHSYSVSTARNGTGQTSGSGCTPTGLHTIKLKIGKQCQPGSVFVGRRFTGEIYSTDLSRKFPERDWILTRILWLNGTEEGINRGGDVDTLRRFIYIHGCPDTEPMGIPLSHGCIRMRNTDIMELFDLVDVGTPVLIKAGELS